MSHAEKLQRKPQILLVDDMDIVLPYMAEQLKSPGFEVVMMHLGKAGYTYPSMLHGTFDDIVKYALNPKNRIDAVVTDFFGPGEIPYGHRLTAALKKAGFNGPVLVHSSTPDPEDKRPMEAGAIGFFSKKEPDKIVEALNTALTQGKDKD